MIRAHKIALDPTPGQALQLARTVGYARKARNIALADFKAGLDDGVWRSVPELKRRFNASKDEALPWCRDLSQHAAKNAIMDLGEALKNWLRDCKKPRKQRRFRFPVFHKRGVRDSYRASNGADTIPVEDRTIGLPKVGAVRMREALRFGGSIREVTVSRTAGRWFASVSVEDGTEAPPVKAGAVVGVDVGVKTLATCSDGTQYDNPRPLAANLRRLRRMQKKLARQVKGSNRRERTKQRIARLHRRLHDLRSDAHHKATSAIAKLAGTVCIESLNVGGMVRNRRLARAVSDAGMSGFLSKLAYKCQWYGARLVQAGRFYPSSKTCSGCGAVKDVLLLSEREYVCAACGLVMDRDLNAAHNLMQYAAESLPEASNGHGDAVRPVLFGQASVGEVTTSPVQLALWTD